MEKAKEGRQDTVRMFFCAATQRKMHLLRSTRGHLNSRVNQKWVCARAEGEGQSAEGVGGFEKRQDSPAG